eukprot:scaffold12598_cov54-Cylindrotheca_fusiformis.AAC.1
MIKLAISFDGAITASNQDYRQLRRCFSPFFLPLVPIANASFEERAMANTPHGPDRKTKRTSPESSVF